MKRLYALLKIWIRKARKYISPVFLMFVAIAATLWYISKLGYTYTTDLNVDVSIDGEKVSVPCMIEAKGTTLLRYKLHGTPSVVIPLSELSYKKLPLPENEDGQVDSTAVQKVQITPSAMQYALSSKFSDVRIISVGNIKEIALDK